MENKKLLPYEITASPALHLQGRHLDRIARRITYLDGKIKGIIASSKDARYEIAEMEALKWAFNLALSAHQTDQRFFRYFAVKFAHKEEL